MDKVRSTIRLLALFSIYFIYKAIMGVIDDNTNEVTIWSLITFVYVISLVIAYFVLTRWEKEQKI
ncbi:unnamed protein product [marine sediment metagenome]|uniref:Uncharacterized protein n=1 Tax=marine sediment metagenome TaxID=412755 RepID=X1DEK6_9ZZZZ